MDKHQGYVVEKIIGNQRETICYDGLISVNCFSERLCPPLSLECVEVAQIRPKAGECCAHRDLKQRIVIVLTCHVVDQNGCCAKGLAEIEVDACRPPHKGNIRRGAEIEVLRACFCRDGVFFGQFSICLHTIVSCGAMIVPSKQCASPCKALPLYPPPAQHKNRWARKTYS